MYLLRIEKSPFLSVPVIEYVTNYFNELLFVSGYATEIIIDFFVLIYIFFELNYIKNDNKKELIKISNVMQKINNSDILGYFKNFLKKFHMNEDVDAIPGGGLP